MRILHIGKHYPPAQGGMERFLGDLVEAQRAAGHEVSVLVHADPGSDAREDPPWLMRCPVAMRLIFAPISPAFPLWLARAIDRHDPDVLHLHAPNPSAFWALLLPSARRRPWVLHWHSDVEPSRFKLSLRLAYPFYRVFERALLERVERIVVASRNYLDASGPLAPWRHKCDIIPLGVAPARLPDVEERETAGLWHGPGLRILAIGRLTYYKGFETLIRAVAGDSERQLAIVGEGEERPALERALAAAGNPGNVRLLGAADDATCHRLLASCDVFALPSRERTEAFGIVLLEAMRYGKPLLASALPGSGVTWVARQGTNSLLAPPDDVPAWREALAALARDPVLRQRLGAAGERRYREEFGIGEVAARIDKVYALATGIAARKTTATGRLLVVIPALNEAETIASVIAQTKAHGEVDVLVVDDGSTDGTAAIARAHGATVLNAPLRQGAWGAIQTGIRYAVRDGYTGVITIDADGQHEPAFLPQMLEAAASADVVIAACASRGSRLRHVAWAYFRLLTGFRYEDLTSGFRYYNARACALLALDEATLLDYQDIGVLLLLNRARLRVSEISVTMNPRNSGSSRIFNSWWTVGRYMAETTLLCLARWSPSAGKR
jgi:glycosyltransferase involved in cell wall biosynthesis